MRYIRHLVVAGAMLAASRPVLAQPSLLTRVGTSLKAIEPELIAFRRDLHQHPEVSGAEVRTAARVAARLRALGLETRTGIGGHGVIGILRGGRPGPVIAYRADMDAVPSMDPDPVSFASLNSGVRHICGHDVHTTIGIALASALARQRRTLPGTVVFIFQPAEERATGAMAMLADGALRDPAPVAIYGLHTAPFPVGQLGTVAGDMMSGHDRYEVTIRGAGDLAAVTDTVRARLTSLGTVPAEAMYQPAPRNMLLVPTPDVAVAAGQVTLRGIVIATSQSRPAVARRMEELRALAIGGAQVSVTYQPKAIPGVFNDAALTTRATAAAARVTAADAMQPLAEVIPASSEDFGAFQDRIPGVFLFLGVSNPAAGTVGMPHTPGFVADEGAILVGARVMAAVLLDRLGQS